MVEHNGVAHHLSKAAKTAAETAGPIGALLFLGVLFCLAAFGFCRLKECKCMRLDNLPKPRIWRR
jgi:hypothetical protein